MNRATISASLEAVRRLAVTKQHLAGELPKKPTSQTILSVIRLLPYVQIDPVSIVAPSHNITLWSRLGHYRLSDLNELLWEEKKLFEYWGHAASIVLMEDYPIYSSIMRRYPESLSKSWGGWRDRARKWIPAHKELRKKILAQLKDGPLQLGQFKEHIPSGKSADGWTSGSDVRTMLFHLQMTGEVMVAGHQGNRNLWSLAESFLPRLVDNEELTIEEFEQEAAQRAIQGLGIASPSEINFYFPRGCYLNLREALKRLEEEAKIYRVHVKGLKDELYVDDKDIPLLESMNTDEWQPRMTLLAPFDNLLCLRGRLNKLFGFDYILEQFLPKNKRKFGTYVLPILWGDRLIGRIDPHMDKTNNRLIINSVHAQPGAPSDKEASSKIAETIEQFRHFLGAKEVQYTGRVPAPWKNSLH